MTTVATLTCSDTERPALEGYLGKLDPCPHRPPREVEQRWACGDGGEHVVVCACCGGPVHLDLWRDALCVVCWDGQPATEGSGHLTRLALDLGATALEGDHDG